jgi:hypothetical protein
MKHACPHCGKEVNPAKMLASIRTPKKEAAWKANGERLKRMYANARKVADAPEDEMPRARFGPSDIEVTVLTPIQTPGVIAPKGSFSKEDLKAMINDGFPVGGQFPIGRAPRSWAETKPLNEFPSAPFDLNIDGEPHRVRQIGKKLMLVYLGADGEVPVRPLAEGELEKLWEKRIQ